MGIKVRSGDVAAHIRQTHGFNKITKFGKILSTGIDRSNIAMNTFTNTLKNSLSNLKAYSSNVATSKAYLDVVRAQTEVILSEMGEMKQLAIQSQNASATNRLALQASLASKQKTIARKLVNAEFGGINIFTNPTVNNNFVVGNGLNISGNIDAVTGKALSSTAGIIGGASAGGNAWNNGINITDIDVEIRIYGEATVSLAAPSTITAGDRIYLSPSTAAVLTFYTGGGPNPPTQGSRMIVGSTSGGAGLSAGNNLRFTTLNGVAVDFFGSQDLSNFTAGNTAINNGVFKVRMTGTSIAAAHDLTITSTGSIAATQVGANRRY